MAAVSPLPKVAFVLQVKITLDPKDTEIFLSHFKPVYDRVLAEPECAYFIIGQNIQAHRGSSVGLRAGPRTPSGL
jgi:hypothetical protein